MTSPATIDNFRRDGVVILRGFYDLDSEVREIQRYIHLLIGQLLLDHNIPSEHPTSFCAQRFDAGFSALVAHDRRLGSTIYDALKHIPAFVRLVGSERHTALMTALYGPCLPAVAGRGYGVRIDIPGEDRFAAPWHQEYPAQLRSPRGMVLWSPLAEVCPEMGPVEVCLRSHHDGIVPVHDTDPNNPERTGAYALRLEDESSRVDRYAKIAPTLEPGDLLVLDYLTIHRSGLNRGTRARWSMQMRFFDFSEPLGRQRAWSGGVAHGVALDAIAPELVARGAR